jgi:hypothetical protein
VWHRWHRLLVMNCGDLGYLGAKKSHNGCYLGGTSCRARLLFIRRGLNRRGGKCGMPFRQIRSCSEPIFSCAPRWCECSRIMARIRSNGSQKLTSLQTSGRRSGNDGSFDGRGSLGAAYGGAPNERARRGGPGWLAARPRTPQRRSRADASASACARASGQRGLAVSDNS